MNVQIQIDPDATVKAIWFLPGQSPEFVRIVYYSACGEVSLMLSAQQAAETILAIQHAEVEE